jgi:hypothetical protein
MLRPPILRLSYFFLFGLMATSCSDDGNRSDGKAGADGSSEGSDTADGDDTGGGGGPGVSASDVYAFTSAFTEGSSVAYSGQVFRQLLIDDMKAHLGGITARIDEGRLFPESGDVSDELRFYFEFDSSVGGQVPLYTSPEPGAMQLVYDDVSAGKNLVGKLAGNDETGQHRDWTTEFAGWSAEGVTSPESLVRMWMATIDAQAVDWMSGDIPLDPSGAPVPAVYVTASGLDLRQLLQKFLRLGITLSQGADDYLDDDIDGKGLLSDHTVAVDGKPYTALEHAWDEGFGYFGASRSYPEWTDAEIAESPGRDVDDDGVVDLLREMNWGHSVNAAKRDAGAVAATDFTADAWDAFYAGRVLLEETAGQGLSAEQLETLRGHRDAAVLAWEQAIAATVVHYINDVLQDMVALEADDGYDFGDHAKHWSELKGFALGFQFNPRSPLSEAEFQALHDLIGMAPVLGDADAAERADYADDLVAARALIADAYGFDAANLGDQDGENGW